MTAPGRDSAQEALAALERLFHKNVITLEEGQAAARLITGDEGFVFPPPPRAPEPPATPVAANEDGTAGSETSQADGRAPG